MPKIDLFASPSAEWETASWTDGAWREANRWENLPADERAYRTAEAWRQWVIASCVEWTGGHSWWLDWDEEDGLWLHCRHCPAGVDEIYPDGQDMIGGELPLRSGKKLRIDGGTVALDAPVQEWHGPVRVDAWLEKHPAGPWGPEEWSAGIWLEAA